MIALIIIGSILLLIAAILFLPVSVWLELKDEFRLKVKFAGICVFKLKPQKEEKPDEEPAEKSDDAKIQKKAKGVFGRLRKKYGFCDAVRIVASFANDVLTHIKKLLRHIKIKKVILDISIATKNAAKTAVEYGAVCSAVYPTLALLESCAGVEYKNINIKSDFETDNSEFAFSLVIGLRIFFLIIAAFGIFAEYKKFIARIESDE